MSLPIITQDLVKGVDFTALNPQTAAEHNQLVELGTPFTDGADAAQGIAFCITTSDTAPNTPQVPNPTNFGFTKWKRYLWNRRPWTGDAQVPKLYMWLDQVSSDATFLKWQLIDPSSYITVGGGAGTPLQTAIDTINTNAANALAAANSATAAVTTIETQIGTVGATDLQTQVTAVTNAEATDAANITLINNAIGGIGLTGTAGINGQIAAIQVALTAGLAQASSLANLTPSPTVGAMIRTNANASALEYFNPADTSNLIVASSTGSITFAAAATTVITLAGTLAIPPGVYIVQGIFGGDQRRSAGSGIVVSQFSIGVGATTINGINVGQDSGSSGAFPFMSGVLGTITVTQATGTVALTASLTNPANTTVVTSGLFCQVILHRISLSI